MACAFSYFCLAYHSGEYITISDAAERKTRTDR